MLRRRAIGAVIAVIAVIIIVICAVLGVVLSPGTTTDSK